MFIEFADYDVALVLIGAAALGAAILPRVVSERPISFPILYLAAGMLVFSLPIGIGPWHPLDEKVIAERLTEQLGENLRALLPFDHHVLPAELPVYVRMIV
jgi:hypothetical protein